jgi:uncharacterized membrane protein
MASSQRAAPRTSEPVLQNVAAIATLEDKAMRERTTAEKVSDAITAVTGSLPFLVLHVLGFALWITINLGAIPFATRFDPFPFGVLTLIVSTEGVFLAIFILISQNRMTRQAERRAHLNLQLSLLAEQELTVMLEMERKLCQHFGLQSEVRDEKAAQLTADTDIRDLTDQLDEALPKT